ncbi:hypothetical protein ACJMK2_005319 [Sinanodonta woodiana]|uniref:Transmembrane protein 180 n=1 Tax=Sinanodonta woodiana TaxID=1069815 RepID=A0ABD3VR98_SINWO
MSFSIFRGQIPIDLCYGSLSLFTTILHNIFLLYHVDMFVSVYKIDKTSFWIGEIIFLIWNSFNDPLFGWISDSSYLSQRLKGHAPSQIVLKRLNALSLNGPLFALAFMTFWISWTYPAIQFVICLCVYDGFLTMIDLHHSALLADLAISAEVRTHLNSRSSLFSILGTGSVFLSYAVWNKDNLHQFRAFCAILALISLLGFTISVTLLKKTFKEQMHKDPILPQKDDSKTSASVGEDEGSLSKGTLMVFAKQLLSQRNFVWFSAMNLVQVFHCHFNSNFFPLFLERLLGDSISPGFGSFLIGISFVAPHINNLYFLMLCRKYGVYTVIRLLFAIKMGLSLFMFLMGPNHIWLLCLFIASNRVFTEGTCKLLNLVISDLVDEDFVLHKRHQAVSALMFGTTALMSKPGQTFAPLIGTWLLSKQIGHDIFESGRDLGSIKLTSSSLDSSTQQLQYNGFFNMLVYIPLFCGFIQLLIWTRFTLHGKRLQWIKSIRSGAEFTAV